MFGVTNTRVLVGHTKTPTKPSKLESGTGV